METVQTVEVYVPEWYLGRNLDEQGFCQEFLLVYPLQYVDGQFFSRKGRMDEEVVRKYVYDYLCQFVHTGLGKKVNTLMETLKMEARKNALAVSEILIYCQNGVYNVNDRRFQTDHDFCRYRLPVDFNPQAPEPVQWKAFLEELLEPEDILTLQEFMGYCLLPVNYAQKMLLIIGKGGEGKSRIGIVMHQLLGQAMCSGSLAKVESSPFARADLQNRLLMVDDDLRLEALGSTNHIKSIITAEQPMDLERKGQQSYQGWLHCRFLAFGNGNLRSLHDRSLGFFRRQIILTTKDRRPGRVDDPYLAARLREELEGILQWCIEGLLRLLDRDMKFTLSRRTRENILCAISEGNNVVDFMKSKGYFRLDPQAETSTRQLYSRYQDWCEDNMLVPLSAKSFTMHLSQNAGQYRISYSNNIRFGDKAVRGFRGIRAC